MQANGAHETCAVPLDADGCVLVDAPCVRCGYNLRTQSRAARCPECGADVSDSLHAFFLRFAPVEWVQRIAHGLSFISNAVLMIAALWVGLVATAIVDDLFLRTGGETRRAIFGCLLPVIGLIALVVTIIGCVHFTTLDPHYVGRREPFFSARRMIRRAMLLLPLPLIGLFAISFLGAVFGSQPPDVVESVVRSWWFWAIWSAGVIISFASYLILPLAVLRRTRELMGRVPAPGLERWAATVYWIAVPVTVLITIGMAILFTLLMWALVNLTPTGGTNQTTSTVGLAMGWVAILMIGLPSLVAIPLAIAAVFLIVACRRRLAKTAEEAAEIQRLRLELEFSQPRLSRPPAGEVS